MADKLLGWFNHEYEKVLHSGLSNNEKDKQYSDLMTEMEHAFKIPMLGNQEWEKENRKVIALYRKISKSRHS
ncbi:hypothetical protein SAMN05421676_10573 [Salinibacillus kushneri]|uniref:Uncharacterized protein n=1 Tax=Salinibacillus kushneri TaxID=237682 RepID=A0A1I0ETZ1_9BACI|nr:hypothetical protein [Salinibacillus kushneri]SET48751.1 hypothetical protein SAMN05421676_10573 [Salinibacillus kushneri]